MRGGPARAAPPRAAAIAFLPVCSMLAPFNGVDRIAAETICEADAGGKLARSREAIASAVLGWIGHPFGAA
jgi:hypothetical protein